MGIVSLFKFIKSMGYNTGDVEKGYVPYKPNKGDYEAMWTYYDIQQNCSKYVWENLPAGLTPWSIERMLYFRGSLVGFKHNDVFYILPYAVKDGLNVYGMPTEVVPYTFNGQANGKLAFEKGFKLPINQTGEYREGEAFLLYDAIPFNQGSVPMSKFMQNRTVIKDMADVMARVNISIVVSNKKIFFVLKDAKQKNIAQAEINKALASDSPYATLTSLFDVQTIQDTKDASNIEEMFKALKQYDSIRCQMSGIKTKGFGLDKKERVSTGELEGQEQQVLYVLDIGEMLRQEFAESINKAFGYDVKVYAKETKEETDGNNMSVEEEMKAGGNRNE